jgi:hypothetical protein
VHPVESKSGVVERIYASYTGLTSDKSEMLSPRGSNDDERPSCAVMQFKLTNRLCIKGIKSLRLRDRSIFRSISSLLCLLYVP